MTLREEIVEILFSLREEAVYMEEATDAIIEIIKKIIEKELTVGRMCRRK